MKKISLIFLLNLSALALFSLASAQTANRVFVTSSTYNSNLGGLAGADAKCQERANAAGLGGNWRAWLSDSKASAAFRLIKSPAPYVLLNGSVIANNWSDLTDGSIGQIRITETGSDVYTPVWTGTNTNGSGSGSYCGDWLSTSSVTGTQGYSYSWQGGATWTSYWTVWCSGSAALYCIEDGEGKAAPDAPLDLKPQAADRKVTLTWKTPNYSGGSSITNYKIYKGNAPNPTALLATVGDVLSYVDTQVSNGANYFYKVTAVNSAGESASSNEVSAVPNQVYRVFLTSSNHNGNLGGLAGADAVCKARANEAGLGGLWKAWLSDSNSSPVSRFNNKSEFAWVRIDGVTVANNFQDLTDGTILNPINVTERGALVNPGAWPAYGRVRTNTAFDGRIYNPGYSCSNFTYGYSWYGSAHGSFGATAGGLWSFDPNQTGNCSWSMPIYCFEQQLVPPDAPLNLKGKRGFNKFELSWSAPSGESPVETYNIYRGTSSNGQGATPIATVPGNTLTYTDSGLNANTNYYYKVKAANSAGESGASNEFSDAKIFANRVFVTSYAGYGGTWDVGSVDGLCQNLANNNKLFGSWRAWFSDSGSSSASRFIKSTMPYRLLDGTIIANNWTDLTDGSLRAPINVTEAGLTLPPVSVWTGTNANGSTAATCSWWGNGTAGNNSQIGSGWSNSTTQSCGSGAALYCFEQDSLVLGAPTNLKAVSDATKITLSWGAPTEGSPTAYAIYRGVSPGGQSSVPVMVPADTFSYIDAEVSNNVRYYYKIKAVNSTRESNFSNEVLGRVPPEVPSAPIVTAVSGPGNITLSWQDVYTGGSPITSYKIYRGNTSGGETLLAQIPASSMVCCDSSYNLYEVKVPPYTDNVGTSYLNRKNFYYKVSAVSLAGEGLLSNEVSAMPITVPGIKNIIATPGEGKVTLTWQVDDGGSPLITRQSTAGPFVYGIDRSPSGGLLGQSMTNSAVVELPSNQLNPPQNQYFGIYTQNSVGQSEYGVAYATARHLSGTWTNVSGSGGTSETCRQWLTRTGQAGKRSRTKVVTSTQQYSSESACSYFSCSGSSGWIPGCVGPVGVCYAGCSNASGFVGSSNSTGNQAFDARYGGDMGAAIRAYYNYNFFPIAGFIGSEYGTQTLQGTGPSLTVTKGGMGTGTVTGTGISCGTTCSTNYVKDESYSFTATPDADSVFSNWTGDCSSAGTNPTCTIIMDSNKTITANFGPKPSYDLTVVKAGAGNGNVSGPGISCGADCVEIYVENTSVTLTASPAPGYIFSGWSGPCSGTGSCNIVMNDVKFVTATFNPPTFTLNVTKTGDGNGSVTSSPAGINCGGDCSEDFSTGSIVMITATPDSNSEFMEWTGSCAGTNPTCALNMDAPKSATATFNKTTLQATTTPGGIEEVRPE